MNKVTIGGKLLREMFLCGAAVLERNKKAVDSLNVFPVPDGDTGTNMSMTMHSAARELASLAEDSSVGEVAKAASIGALKGARGNSGVILSQILRGFSRALKDAENMDSALLKDALVVGTESAYKAVIKPKEGTMLTVVRTISESLSATLEQNPNQNVYSLIDHILEVGEDALRKTPDQLPVLKEAGVVDSGGMGLLCLFNGFKAAIDGDAIGGFELEDLTSEAQAPAKSIDYHDNEALLLGDINDIEFGYCTEFFIIHPPAGEFSDEEIDKFRDKITRIGDSVVLASESDFVKVHVHSNCPGKIIQLALRLGEVNNIKIENMREQNREIAASVKKNEREQGIAAVCAGDGIEEIFRDLSVSSIISGGQTMNPSIEAISAAIRRANAKTVFVFPNNSNIIMAAQQAADLSEREVIVIPSKTVMQGISGVMAFNPDLGAQENARRMNAAIKATISGSITYAVRDTQFEGKHISEGDIIGLIDNKISVVGDNVAAAARELVNAMIAMQPEDPVITVLYGEGVEEAQAQELADDLSAEHEDAEFIVQYGGQPLYYYYFSLE